LSHFARPSSTAASPGDQMTTCNNIEEEPQKMRKNQFLARLDSCKLGISSAPAREPVSQGQGQRQ
jgi:hypothetical protein